MEQRYLVWRVAGMFSLLLLSACTDLAVKDDHASVTTVTTGEEPLPFKSTVHPAKELSSELIYNILLGEVASQRGDLGLAHDAYLAAARLAGDAESAEQATRMALLQKDYSKAQEAAALWISVDPNNLSARQLMVAILLELDAADDALLEHMEAIVTISRSKHSDGFVHAVSALSRSKDPERAIAIVRKLRAAHTGDVDAEYAVALMASVLKQEMIAEKESRGLIARHPDEYRGYILLSRIFIRRADKEGARQLLAQGVERNPRDPKLRSAYAGLLLDMHRVEAAYTQFKHLSELTPEQAKVHFSLGVIALQLERLDAARESLLRSLELDPTSHQVAYYLGRIEEIEGNNERARHWYKQVSNGELNYEAQLRLARIQAEGGELGDARGLLQALRIRYPKKSIDLYLAEADLFKLHGKPSEVLEVYSQGLKAFPENDELLYARALFAATQGDVAMLERDLRQVLADNPEHADALNALGYTLADQTDRYQEALGYIERALAMKGDSAAILDSMGWVQYRLGRYSEALTYLKRAREMLDDAEISAHLGEVLWVSGDRDEARKVWQSGLQIDPENQYLLKTIKRFK